MRWISIILLTQIAMFGQAPKPEELSILEGKVLNSATGESLSKTTLTLARIDQKSEQSNWEQSYTASSDSSGKFVIRNIAAGQYRLSAKRIGFLDFEYGAHAAQANGTVLDLKQPQQIKDAELRLSPQGVIIGRILDTDGDPMEAVVKLLRQRYANGKKVMVAARRYAVNELGEYRISGLSPGKYYLYAEARMSNTPLSERPEVYVPAYYPGATDAAGALAIDVLPGSQIRAGDLILRTERAVKVRGRVVVNVPGIDGFQAVQIYPSIGHEDTSGYMTVAASATVRSSGEFEARGLTLGSYRAVATLKGNSGYYGSVKFDVSGSDVENVIITVDTGLTITGRVVVEGETKQSLNGLRVLLLPGRIPPVSGYGFQGVSVTNDLTFRDTHMPPDIYAIEMRNLPDGFYVKRIRAGSIDGTDTGIDFRSGVRIPLKAISDSGGKPIRVPAGKPIRRRSEATLALRCCQS